MVVSSQLLVLANLALGNNTQYPLNRRLGWSQNQSRCFWGQKKYLAPAQDNFPPQLQNKVNEFNFLAVQLIFICVYITNYLHFFTVFLRF
jgi:hypothetical protein